MISVLSECPRNMACEVVITLKSVAFSINGHAYSESIVLGADTSYLDQNFAHSNVQATRTSKQISSC